MIRRYTSKSYNWISVSPGTTIAVWYSNIEGGWDDGDGNINANPLFVGSAVDNYHLQANSPCIDAGTNYFAPQTDMDGTTRPLDGDGDGDSRCDMGAYEYEP